MCSADQTRNKAWSMSLIFLQSKRLCYRYCDKEPHWQSCTGVRCRSMKNWSGTFSYSINKNCSTVCLSLLRARRCFPPQLTYPALFFIFWGMVCRSSLGWHWTHSDLSASALQVLGLQTCTTICRLPFSLYQKFNSGIPACQTLCCWIAIPGPNFLRFFFSFFLSQSLTM